MSTVKIPAKGNPPKWVPYTFFQVYFCDPQSPWQRGSNEHSNRLLLQYFPKATALLVHSQTKLNAVARQLNEHPGKTLDFDTPAERFNIFIDVAIDRLSRHA